MLPLDLGVCLLFLYGLDSISPLLFFAVHHDDFDAGKGKRAADFISAALLVENRLFHVKDIPDAERTASHNRDASIEVLGVHLLWTDDLA